jgi:hypothetical protein
MGTGRVTGTGVAQISGVMVVRGSEGMTCTGAIRTRCDTNGRAGREADCKRVVQVGVAVTRARCGQACTMVGSETGGRTCDRCIAVVSSGTVDVTGRWLSGKSGKDEGRRAESVDNGIACRRRRGKSCTVRGSISGRGRTQAGKS